jgi:tRNA pseudouridine13 synthase
MAESDDRPTKRLKLDEGEKTATLDSLKGTLEDIFPPSYVLLGRPPRSTGGLDQLAEQDVGISEYISKDLSPIEGIIKQRYVIPILIILHQQLS